MALFLLAVVEVTEEDADDRTKWRRKIGYGSPWREQPKEECSTGRTRSSQQHLLEVPQTNLVSFGDRSFNVVSPWLWNALPIAIKRIDTVPLFVKALKTHIFKEEFCWHFKAQLI